MPVGNVISTFTMRLYGRKLALISSHLPWIMGWLFLSFSQHFWSLLLGCFLIGFSAGFNSAVGNIYFAETCEPRLRGLFLGFISTSVSIGILLSHSLGILFYWRTALRISASIPTLSLVLSTFCPESVSWLVLKGRTEQAEKNFFWLRGNSVDNEREFRDLLNRRVENIRRNRRGLIKNIFSSKFLKPFFILVLLFTVQQGSGLNVIIFYAMDMLTKMSKDIGVARCTILIDIVRFISAVISCILLKCARRRTLYFLSAACTILSLIVTATAITTNLPPTVLIISLCTYICSMQAGIITLPWLMNSEVFKPTDVIKYYSTQRCPLLLEGQVVSCFYS